MKLLGVSVSSTHKKSLPTINDNTALQKRILASVSTHTSLNFANIRHSEWNEESRQFAHETSRPQF